MSEREQRINQGLRALDEAHYSGRINREEYRLRRRQLLGSLCESHGVTVRNTLRGRGARGGPDTQRNRMPAAPAEPASRYAASSATPVAWKAWLLFALGLGVCALLLYWLLRGN